MTHLDNFAIAARHFCAWAEGIPPLGSGQSEMSNARHHLSALYAMAVGLPRIQCDWTERQVTHDDWSRVFQRCGSLPVGYYGSVCDPLEILGGDTSMGDLADDLADIWRDLKEGLILFDEGRHDAAGCCWQESFAMHWGEHAVNGLAVIHYWLARHGASS